MELAYSLDRDDAHRLFTGYHRLNACNVMSVTAFDSLQQWLRVM